MGLNLDLEEMLGLPSETVCRKCGNKTKTYFDDLDIESGGVVFRDRTLKVNIYCDVCEYEDTRTIKFSWQFE